MEQDLIKEKLQKRMSFGNISLRKISRDSGVPKTSLYEFYMGLRKLNTNNTKKLINYFSKTRGECEGIFISW